MHLYMATKSALIRTATAWWFSGPALFSTVMSRAKKPSPETAERKVAQNMFDEMRQRESIYFSGSVLWWFTEGCGSKSGPSAVDTSVTGNNGNVASVSEENYVGLFAWDVHVFLVNPLFDKDDHSVKAVVRREIYSICDGGEVPRSILRHRELFTGVVIVAGALQDPSRFP